MLVTNDRTDFTTLVQREPRHPGLVCITVAHGLMSLDAQTRLFDVDPKIRTRWFFTYAA